MSGVENGKAIQATEIAIASDERTADAQGGHCEEAFERWLRDEVAGTYDKMKADPSRALSVRQAFDEIRARHFAKVAARR